MTLSSTLPRSAQQRSCGPLFASPTHPSTWCFISAIAARPEHAMLHICIFICKCRTVPLRRATFRCASQSDFPVRSAERLSRALRRAKFLCAPQSDFTVRSAERRSRALRGATCPFAPHIDMPVRSAGRLSGVLRRATIPCAPHRDFLVRSAERNSCALRRTTLR